jgi:RNA polymerase sigma factor (sigma-70 family)
MPPHSKLISTQDFGWRSNDDFPFLALPGDFLCAILKPAGSRVITTPLPAMAPDCDLLRQYAENRDETAFAEVVRRYVDLVYATALRLLNGDAHLAQDVTQTVFTDLARNTAALRERATIAGWLHTSARFHASKTVRTERRRRAREQEALAMSDPNATAEFSWEQLRPLLDEAVGQLADADRDAVLLRFFQGKSHREVGVILGLDENTARMRVERTVEKLRRYFSQRGVTTTAALLATTLGAQAANVQAPAAFSATVATKSLAGIGGAASGVSVGVTGGVSILFLGMKWLVGLAVVMLLAGLALIVFTTREKTPHPSANASALPMNPSNPSARPPTLSRTTNNMTATQVINRGTLAIAALMSTTTTAPAQYTTANVTSAPPSAVTMAVPSTSATIAAPTIVAPIDPRTMLGHLSLVQSDLKEALASLNRTPTAAHGGFVERAKVDVNKTLADMANAIAYIQAHPEANKPNTPTQDETMKIDPAIVPVRPWPAILSYAGYVGFGNNRNKFTLESPDTPGLNRDMVGAYFFSKNASEALATRVYNFPIQTAADFTGGPGVNQTPGEIGGYREVIWGDITLLMFDVASGLDYAHRHATGLGGPSADGELVLNGDFESPVGSVTIESLNIPPNLDPSSFGWRTRFGSPALMHEGYRGNDGIYNGTAASGKQWLNLDGGRPGAIEQTIDTTAGSQYTLSFAYANSPNPGVDHPFAATVNVKDVVSDTDLVTPMSIIHSTSMPTDFHWDRFTISFIATGPTTTIRFTSNDITGHDGIFIDSVSVKPAGTAAAATTVPSKP